MSEGRRRRRFNALLLLTGGGGKEENERTDGDTPQQLAAAAAAVVALFVAVSLWMVVGTRKEAGFCCLFAPLLPKFHTLRPSTSLLLRGGKLAKVSANFYSR